MPVNHLKIWIFCSISKRIRISSSWHTFSETNLSGIRKEVNMKNYTGFTLVELIVVIALISLISAVAVPNIIVWRQNSQLNGQPLEY